MMLRARKLDVATRLFDTTSFNTPSFNFPIRELDLGDTTPESPDKTEQSAVHHLAASQSPAHFEPLPADDIIWLSDSDTPEVSLHYCHLYRNQLRIALPDVLLCNYKKPITGLCPEHSI
jgi:hypothetical protein